MIGTGVKGSGITICAASAVSNAKPMTSAAVIAVERGSTTPVITRDGMVVCTKLPLC